MADTKISALTAATAAAAANELAINEAGTSKKLSVDLLQQFLGVIKVRLTSDNTVSSTTGTEVTGLSVTLVAGTYRYSYFLIVQSATLTVGLKFGVNYTGTTTAFVARLTWPDTGANATTGTMDQTGATPTGQILAHNVAVLESTTTTNLAAGTGVAAINTNIFVEIKGTMVVSDGGDLELWHASETATSTTVKAGSNLVVTRIP